MGTHIKIGQPCIVVDDDGNVGIDITEARSPDGATPPFYSYPLKAADGLSEPTNHAMLALDALDAFAPRVGLDELFNDGETGFTRWHPCGPIATKLTPDHLAQFIAAQDRAQATAPERKGDIGFLAWLIYWTRWALEHCEIPTIWIF